MIWIAMAKALGVVLGLGCVVALLIGWIELSIRIFGFSKWGSLFAIAPVMIFAFALFTLIFAGVIQ